jgi:Rod binding domain-containing protein
MEVGSLSAPTVDASRLPLDRLAANANVSEPEKIAVASRAFEALLLRQILQETQRPVFASKFVGNSTVDGIYRDMVVEQLADNISRSGSFGLAKSLTGELTRQSGAGRQTVSAAQGKDVNSQSSNLQFQQGRVVPPAACRKTQNHE